MIDESEGLGWFLEGVLRGGRTWIIPVEPLPFLIGRGPDCNLSLTAKSISRRHAEIFQRQSGLWIRDLGSKNGTLVNRRKISREEPVSDGDILMLGTVEFRIGLNPSTSKVEETSTSLSVIPTLLPYCEPEFRAMLDKGAVVPHYQPIVNLANHGLLGYEVISRGNFEGLPTQPIDLFKIAKDLDCEGELSRLFWQKGLAEGRSLSLGTRLFINLHPSETQAPGLVRALEEARLGMPDTPITVEISEETITDLLQMRRLREQLKALDIHLAYDDFGAGQARLLELVDVPPDYLKFDASLIRDLHKKPKRHLKMVSTLVEMAKEMGIATVAEGVECGEEEEACRTAGFEYAQGYHFGRPQTAAGCTA